MYGAYPVMTPGISSPTITTPRPVVAILAPSSALPLLTPTGKQRTNLILIEGRTTEKKAITRTGNGTSVMDSIRDTGQVNQNGQQVVKQSMPEDAYSAEDASYSDG